ncbi:MAG: hypothetical protein IT302_05320 [Dehalococcoidia bacterium]|nr:hypothetical protein [Dehalococcoidia bacterium]
MRIDTSFLNFANQRLAPARDPQRPWRTDRAAGHHHGPRPTRDATTISDAAREAARAARANEADPAGEPGDPQVRFIAALVKAVTGQDVQITGIEDATFTSTTEHTTAAVSSVAGSSGPDGTRLALREATLESETTTIEASAIVHTADGQDLKVTISFTLSRSSLESNDFALAIGGAAGDTPAIRFDGDASALGSRRFTFDLPVDSTRDSAPRHGAGFMHVDHGNARPSSADLLAARPGKAYEAVRDHDDDRQGHVDEDDHAYRFLKHLAKDHGDEAAPADDAGASPTAANDGVAGAVQQVDLSA